MNAGEQAVAMLDRVLELAPTFAPAISAHAMASIRAWWGDRPDEQGARGARARASVERALADAPALAETHQARGMMAIQIGEYREAALAFGKVIEIAPTMPEAHFYLADLQIDAGRLREGERRLRLASELDPTTPLARLSLARCAALRGDFPESFALLDRLDEEAGSLNLATELSRVRFALWAHDRERAARAAESVRRSSSDAAKQLTSMIDLALGAPVAEVVRGQLEILPRWLRNPRFTSLMLQVVAEMACAGGHVDLALDAIEAAAAGILVDIEWLDRCGLFVELRGNPRFTAVRDVVRSRADAVWRR